MTKQNDPLAEEDLKQVQGAGSAITAQQAGGAWQQPPEDDRLAGNPPPPQQTRIMEFPISPSLKP